MADALADLRAAFPVAKRWIYFNHAAVSPMSLPVRDAVAGFLEDATRQGSTGFASWLQRREEARIRAAELLSTDPATIAFTTSTSQGLLTVAEGLNWSPGDEILLIEDDFPANHIPWFRQERKGARVRLVPRRDGRVLVDDILERLTDSVRVVAVPSVLYDNGFRLDLAALGAALADTRALFCVDAIQSLGAFPLSVEAHGIDFLSADSHKWMLGLEGIGILYVRKQHLSTLDPPFVSWCSMEEPFATYRPGAPMRADARRFEYACLPTATVYGMDACLRMLLETGTETMAGRILELTDRLVAGLSERGWAVDSPREIPAECSGIVRAHHPDQAAEGVVEQLEQRGISVAARGGGIRFSPHAWNTPDEVDTLLDRLP
jgi:selenocysteine lyase/cysteine desulfurase